METFNLEKNIGSHFAPGGTSTFFTDARVSDLVARFKAEQDADKREALIRELFTVNAEELYVIPLWSAPFIWGIDPQLEWQPPPDGALFVAEVRPLAAK